MSEEKNELIETPDYEIEMTQEHFGKLIMEMKKSKNHGIGGGYIFDGKNFVQLVRREDSEKNSPNYINAQKEEDHQKKS